jgi:two-component system sensor histidine kinase PrrB
MSLRWRVALFTAAVSSLVLTLGAAAFVAAFRSDQVAVIDALLEQSFDQVARPASTAARLDRPALDQLVEVRAATAVVVRVWDGGDLLLEAGAAGSDLGPPAEGLATTEDGSHRVLGRRVEPVLAAPDPLLVQVGFSLDAADQVFSRLRVRMRRLVVLGTGLFALGGWLAAGPALRPLRRLRLVTEQVAETSDLSHRVALAAGPVEVAELARSFDVMLDRLETADHRREEALEAARTFAAAAAHELRTPLTSLGTNLEMLASDPDHPERDAAIADLVTEHARMVDLIGGLRLLAQADLAGPELFEEVDLTGVVEAAVLDARRRHPAAKIGLAGDEVTMPGWQEGLRVMADNLLGNALIHGRSSDGSALVEVTISTEGHRPRLAVSDHGPGIPPADRPRMLERFVRGEGVTGLGSGLGLALVAQQAAIHGGGVEIDETPGGGTTVIVSFAG